MNDQLKAYIAWLIFLVIVLIIAAVYCTEAYQPSYHMVDQLPYNYLHNYTIAGNNNITTSCNNSCPFTTIFSNSSLIQLNISIPAGTENQLTGGSYNVYINGSYNDSIEYGFNISTEEQLYAKITTEKGVYTSEEITLQAEAPNHYTIYYAVHDGAPPFGLSSWTQMGKSGNIHSASIDFMNQEEGAVYIKITDSGRTKIQFTGIVSAPYFKITLSDREQAVYPKETAKIKVNMDSKLTDNDIKCRMDDFKGNSTGWQIASNTKLVYGDKIMLLKNSYEEKLTLEDEDEDLILEAYIPEGVSADYYTTKLRCITE